MSNNGRKSQRSGYTYSRKKSVMLLTLLIGSLILWILYRFLKKSPEQFLTIKEQLTKAGLNDQTIKFWIAVSAHETAFADNYQTPWSSPVYTQNNNLFGMRLAGSNTTAVSSNLGHAVYRSLADSAKDLALYFTRLNWGQLNFDTIPELTAYMKSKGYFTAPLDQYTRGVEHWYKKLGL